jgi:hypothetical protein
MAEAEATERDIDAAREGYRPVARRAALLFFAASELAGVDPMYQYSLGWFRALFVRGMEDTPKVRSQGATRACTRTSAMAASGWGASSAIGFHASSGHPSQLVAVGAGIDVVKLPTQPLCQPNHSPLGQQRGGTWRRAQRGLHLLTV